MATRKYYYFQVCALIPVLSVNSPQARLISTTFHFTYSSGSLLFFKKEQCHSFYTHKKILYFFQEFWGISQYSKNLIFAQKNYLNFRAKIWKIEESEKIWKLKKISKNSKYLENSKNYKKNSENPKIRKIKKNWQNQQKMHIKNFSFVDFWHENSIFSRNISRKSSILTNKTTKIQVLKK